MNIDDFIDGYLKEGGDKGDIQKFLEGTFTEEEIRRALKKRGITYINYRFQDKVAKYLADHNEFLFTFFAVLFTLLIFISYPTLIPGLVILSILTFPKMFIVYFVMSDFLNVNINNISKRKVIMWSILFSLFSPPALFVFLGNLSTSIYGLVIVFGLISAFNIDFKKSIYLLIYVSFVDLIYSALLKYLLTGALF